MSVRDRDCEPQRQLGKLGATEADDTSWDLGQTSGRDVAPPRHGKENHGDQSESPGNNRAKRKARVKYSLTLLLLYVVTDCTCTGVVEFDVNVDIKYLL